MSKDKPYSVFISYLSEDRAVVLELIRELEARGVKAWVDRKKITPGIYWADAIKEAIWSSEYVIVCFSMSYSGRPCSFMRQELTWAIESFRRSGIPRIIPVRLSDCAVPSISIDEERALCDLQWIDMFPNWDSGTRQVLSVFTPSDLSVPVTLRSQYDYDLQPEAVESMIRHYDFFDARLNRLGLGIATNYKVIEYQGARIVSDQGTELAWLDRPDLGVQGLYRRLPEALEFVNGLWGGVAYWRIPTHEEAMSLLKPTKNQNGLHIDAVFKNRLPHMVTWDDCKLPEDHERILDVGHWTVNLAAGESFLETKWDRLYLVRPVCRHCKLSG